MIHQARIAADRNITTDRAILDILELQELDMAPGILIATDLMRLWHCSQSQVSRRLAAIDRLGPWRVQVQGGRGSTYCIAPRLKPAPPLPAPELSPRERWEVLRRQWREVVA